MSNVATLMPVAGVGFDAPRWIPGTEQMLVVRSAPLPDGRARADVYRWDTKTGAVERITERAGIREVDPLPDAKSAAAVTCGAGTCGLVLVDLATAEDIALMRSAVGPTLGVKASGGVRDAASAKAMIEAGATRLGASASVAIVRGGKATGAY